MTTKNETPKNDFNATIGNTVLADVLIVKRIKILKNANIKKRN